MNGAIFGSWGAFFRHELDEMDRRLSHRGSRSVIRPVGPDVLLAWRGDASGQQSASVPLVCACRLLNRAELVVLTGSGKDSEPSDAELLWKLYSARGPEGFAKINGYFALALYDPESASVVLAVDSWASRPLSFARTSRGFAFATEYKALLALTDVELTLNRSAIAHLQATKYLPTGEGLLSEVQPVAPGSWVRLRPGECSGESYHPVVLEPQLGRSSESYAAELRDALLRSCERLTSGFESIGVSLSGGIDSTLTVGAVRAVAPKMPLHTYTVSFSKDDPVLERARETATHFGTIHREIVVSVDALPQLVPELVWIMEDPVAREEMLIYFVLARAASGDVPCLLHGHLADMLFGGMPRHMLVHAASGTPVLRKAMMELYDYSQTGASPTTLFGGVFVRAYYRGRRTPPPRVLGVEQPAPGSAVRFDLDQPLNTLLIESLGHPTEFSCVERLHARYKLDYGSPFHDLEVARCAFRVPDSMKIHGTCRKYILRKAATGILPPDLVSRRKDIIRIPRNDALKTTVRVMADELLSSETVLRRGIFEPEDVVHLVRIDSTRLADDRFYHLWTLLLTECWMRTFVDGRGMAPTLAGEPRERHNLGPEALVQRTGQAAAACYGASGGAGENNQHVH